MKFKADENIGTSGVELLRGHGHDVATVREQGLGGAEDETVFRACAAERRTLITLDRDFGQVARFRPRQTAGIVCWNPAAGRLLRFFMPGFVIFLHLPRRARSTASSGSSSPAAFGCIWRRMSRPAPGPRLARRRQLRVGQVATGAAAVPARPHGSRRALRALLTMRPATARRTGLPHGTGT